MYMVMMYDVEAKRTGKFRKLLRRYLSHTQYSVFSGDITESQAMRLRHELGDLLESADRVVEILTANRQNIEVYHLKVPENHKGKMIREPHEEHRRDFGVL